MEYHHPQYAYSQGHIPDPRAMPMQLHHQHSHPQLMEAYMHPHSHLDYADFPLHPGMHEEYEDGQEILSRPRLTKEQVEVLESQFQAHPKPNSNVKRQLAIQTKLTLPRVANWFQNRRAKAKQQKKQEEFEILQSMGQDGSQKSDVSKQAPHPYPQSAGSNTSEQARAASLEPEDTLSQQDMTPPTHSLAVAPTASPIARTTSAQEASWASLQRALASAQAANGPQYTAEDTFIPTRTLESPLQASDIPSSNDSSTFPSSTFSDWTAASSVDWVSSSHSNEQFDFGNLNVQNNMQADHFANPEPQIMFRQSPEDVSDPGSEEWLHNLQTPTLGAPHGLDMGLPMPPYAQTHDSRHSSSEDLTAGFGNIGLTTPTSATSSHANMFPRPDHSIDIAARRKKPRPAMLGTAALRSRSYGAPPTLSPTVRYSSSPVHPLRHVKSTGNSLNVHYGGIRKPSSAQRSPLNIATFAEAEALNAMMAGVPTMECPSSDLPDPHTSLSPEERHSGIPIPSSTVEAEIPGQFYQLSSNMHLNVTSPPATPMKQPEFFGHPQMTASLVPPMSAPPQYAVFPDYTPPYSAGPLTAGSWSDAPLTSPEHATFGQALNMPQPNYISGPMVHDYGSVTNFSLPFSSTSEMKADYQRPTTEFFIQEFPQQREAHAHAAQQMAQQKPKNYVFANATANDFSE